jgi:hypothetical protein
MPRNSEKFFPKFDLDKKDLVKNCIKKLLSAIRLKRIRHVDFDCPPFPLNFKEHESTWYLSLEEASISNWRTFENSFLWKFGGNKTLVTRVLELSRVKMDVEELVTDYNQRLLTSLK